MTKDDLKSLIGSVELTAVVNDIIAYIVQNRQAVDSALSTANGKITTLIGSDTGKSVRTIANEELAAQLIPSTASEALDTLQEIAAWIQAHPGDAATMNSAITALQTLISASASNNAVTVESTQKLKDAVASAESALQLADFGTIGQTAAKAIVSAAITAAETPASGN